MCTPTPLSMFKYADKRQKLGAKHGRTTRKFQLHQRILSGRLHRQKVTRASPVSVSHARSRGALLSMTNPTLQFSETAIPYRRLVLVLYRHHIYLLVLRPLQPLLRPLPNFGLNNKAFIAYPTTSMSLASRFLLIKVHSLSGQSFRHP